MLQNITYSTLYSKNLCYISHKCSAATAISSSLIVKCPMEQDEVWGIQWPFAAPGSTQSVRCPGEGDASGLGLAHRSCLAGGMWDAVDVTACESPAVREVRIEVYSSVYTLAHSDTCDNTNF